MYALDQRGHGDSEPATVYNPIVAFDDIAGVIEQLGLTSLVMVGLSMGGRNAMYFAAKRPEAVKKLVIVDIGPEISKKAGQAPTGPPEPDAWESIEQAAQHLYRSNPYPGIHYYRWVVSESLRPGPDGGLVWAWHPSIKERDRRPTSTGGDCSRRSCRRPSCCAARRAPCWTVTWPSAWDGICRTASSSRSRAPSTRCTRTIPRPSSPRSRTSSASEKEGDAMGSDRRTFL